MAKRLLFLTNFGNSNPEEDLFLIDTLKQEFQIIATHPLECRSHLSEVDGVIIRNIWPIREYMAEWREVQKDIEKSGLPIHNPFQGQGDFAGKDYLVDLFKHGFPVIPSINSLEDLPLLPDSREYLLKLKLSCDGIGAKRVSKFE